MTTCNVCGEKVPAAELLDHLRLFHPDQYGDGEIAEGIVEEEDPGIEVARITIIRRLTEDDTLDYVEALDGNGDDLPLTEALGMMRLAEDTLIRDRMDDGGEDR